MKKLTAYLLSFIIILSNLSCNVFAEDSLSAEQKIEKLKELKIVHCYEDGEFYPDKNISRSEFCKMICLMFGNLKEETATFYFEDVSVDHWANKYIAFCRSKKLINGVYEEDKLYFVDLDENGNEIGKTELEYIDSIANVNNSQKYLTNRFEPDESITYQDALKILVTVLGYEEDAKGRGAYPEGYLLVADRIGITEKIEFNNTDMITRKNAAEFIYNSLFIPMMIRIDKDDEDGARAEYYIADGINGNEFQTLHFKYFESMD